MMRTNINIDDYLIDECRRLSSLKNKKEIVDAALREFIKSLKRRRMLLMEGGKKGTTQKNSSFHIRRTTSYLVGRFGDSPREFHYTKIKLTP
jgi:Arc/MetJ family transcription regulator